MSDDAHQSDNPECPHCKEASKRSNALRKRIIAQLEAWGAPPDHVTCAALIAVAGDCVDGGDPRQVAWFVGLAASVATGKEAQLKIVELPKPPEPTRH